MLSRAEASFKQRRAQGGSTKSSSERTELECEACAAFTWESIAHHLFRRGTLSCEREFSSFGTIIEVGHSRVSFDGIGPNSKTRSCIREIRKIKKEARAAELIRFRRGASVRHLFISLTRLILYRADIANKDSFGFFFLRSLLVRIKDIHCRTAEKKIGNTRRPSHNTGDPS